MPELGPYGKGYQTEIQVGGEVRKEGPFTLTPCHFQGRQWSLVDLRSVDWGAVPMGHGSAKKSQTGKEKPEY